MADYSIPAWLQFDPAQRINSAITQSRQQRDQEQNTRFNQDVETQGLEAQQQQMAQKTQMAARQALAQQNFRQKVQGLDLTKPEGQAAYRAAMLEYGSDSGQFTPGFSQTVKALTPVPPKPAPATPTWVPPNPQTGAPGYFNTPGRKPAIPRPPTASGFNLRPGETRFGPDGKPIASLPARPQTPRMADVDKLEYEGLLHQRGALQQEYTKLMEQSVSPGDSSAPTALPASQVRRIRASLDDIDGKLRGIQAKYSTPPAGATAAPPVPAAASAPTASPYKTPADVGAALKAGKIKRADAHQILQSQFGYSE